MCPTPYIKSFIFCYVAFIHICIAMSSISIFALGTCMFVSHTCNTTAVQWIESRRRLAAKRVVSVPPNFKMRLHPPLPGSLYGQARASATLV